MTLRLPADFESFHCGQRKPEFLAWASICIASQPESYVELGTGHAAYMAAMGIPKVVAVDINNPIYGIASAGVRYFAGDSHDITTMRKVVVEQLGDAPDIVFIDADHDGDAPEQDFNLWYPVAKKLIGFHDIQIPNVRRIWDRLALKYPSCEILGRDLASAVAWQGPLCPQDGILSGGGIGVIWK